MPTSLANPCFLFWLKRLRLLQAPDLFLASSATFSGALPQHSAGVGGFHANVLDSPRQSETFPVPGRTVAYASNFLSLTSPKCCCLRLHIGIHVEARFQCSSAVFSFSMKESKFLFRNHLQGYATVGGNMMRRGAGCAVIWNVPYGAVCAIS